MVIIPHLVGCVVLTELEYPLCHRVNDYTMAITIDFESLELVGLSDFNHLLETGLILVE